MNTWFNMDTSEAMEKLASDGKNGLSEQEAQARLAEHGTNELTEKGLKSLLKILWEQLTAIMVVILIIAAIVSFFLGEYVDGVFIIVIVFLNAILGVSQEFKAEKAMAALKRLAVPKVRVTRDGAIRELDATSLVPGDLILIESGNAIPADCRINEAINLKIQEAALTGESEPVEKTTAALKSGSSTLGDRTNMAYMGTFVTAGRGSALVVATGMKTELGKIASLIQNTNDESTPLQKRLEQLGKGLALAALIVVVVVFSLGLIRDGVGMDNVRLMFMTAVSMAVAAVPEGLPAIVTVALALGAQRMLKRKALIRKLMAVETLGSVTVICSDKTGTLTENRMTVTLVDVYGHSLEVNEYLGPHGATSVVPFADTTRHPDAVNLLLKAGALCNDAVLSRVEAGSSFKSIGDPTEAAIVVAAARFGIAKTDLEALCPRTQEIPFDSDRKRMSTLHKIPGAQGNPLVSDLVSQAGGKTYVLFTKGAVDQILPVTAAVYEEGKVIPLSPEVRQRIISTNENMARNGMRVLGIAFKPLAEPKASLDVPAENGLIFLGMVAMIDPPRLEVKRAVAICRTAGIKPVMITGDHPLTAMYIARELGIATNDRILTGHELQTMSAADLEKVVDDISVYARVSPEHKLSIVAALKSKGHVVAMTGDGINDAPALKKADIGVAMGITGTDVSKEASDMVLQDDNFATIVAAVEEGRIIYDNIRKFIRYLLTSNAGEIVMMLFAPFIGMPLPLLPLQILWINLVTDGFPALALSVEPAEKNIMQRKPTPPGENIFARGMGIHMIWAGLFMGLISLGTSFVYWLMGRNDWQTMGFCVITFTQMAHVLAIRSGSESLFKAGLLSNKLLAFSVFLTILLQCAVVYVPFLQDIFKTQALPVADLMISIGLSAVVFAAVEIEKAIIRKMGKKENHRGHR